MFKTPRPGTRRAGVPIPAKRVPLARPLVPPRYAAVALGSGLLLTVGAVETAFRGWVPVGLTALVMLACFAAGMVSLICASMDVRPPQRVLSLTCRLRHVVLAGVLALTLDSVLAFSLAMLAVFSAPLSVAYNNDVIAFAHMDAELVLEGQNPYVSDWAMRVSMERFPNAPATPLRRGAFGTGYDYPTGERLTAVERQYIADPTQVHGAFDPRTLHSYPALSFLVYVPILWAGIGNIMVLHLLVLGGLFLWLVWVARVGQRGWAALAAATALGVQAISLVKDTEVICVALLLAAWHLRDRRWVGTILLGLACAFKQYCWFFVPFFALDLVRRYGWPEAARRAPIAALAFLLPNLPYIIMSPAAWWQSLWLPMSLPLFPRGVGIINLSISHVLPFAPALAYAALELLALVATLWAFWRWHAQFGESALLLSLIPLTVAYRSPDDYFAFMPWLALYAASQLCARMSQSSRTPALVA